MRVSGFCEVNTTQEHCCVKILKFQLHDTGNEVLVKIDYLSKKVPIY